MDGILYVLGACEQPDEEYTLLKQLLVDYDKLPIFCAINRIDEPNTVVDLEKNIKYIEQLINPLHINHHLVSGYLGFFSKQWEREPEKYDPIVTSVGGKVYPLVP